MIRTFFRAALLVSALSLLPAAARAQRRVPAPTPATALPDSLVALPTAAAAEVEYTEYCLLNFEGNGIPETFIDADFGLGTKNKAYTPGQVEIIKKLKATPSAVGALLLLRKQGWEIAHAYVGPVSATKLSHFYLLKRRGNR